VKGNLVIIQNLPQKDLQEGKGMFTINQAYSILANEPMFSTWNCHSISTTNELVSAHLYCNDCEILKTFWGKAYSINEAKECLDNDVTILMEDKFRNMGSCIDYSEVDPDKEIIDQNALPVGNVSLIKLICPTCKTVIYLTFHAEAKIERNIIKEKGICSDLYYRITKIGEYPNQETSRLMLLDKYKTRFPTEYDFLVKAARSFYQGLGAAAMLYMRKAYETLENAILDEAGITAKSHKEGIILAHKEKNIIPTRMKGKVSALYGEFSKIVHGDLDEEGLTKFEDFRKLFLKVLDKIIINERREARAAKLLHDKNR
jgi:hypothetical protein